jgi:hypothetical protein
MSFRVATRSRVVISYGALEVLGTYSSARALVDRHRDRDWGVASAEIVAQNQAALLTYGRLQSQYKINGKLIIVITDVGWRTTSVTVPEEE